MSNRDRLIKSINALGRKNKASVLIPMGSKPTPTPRKRIQSLKSTESIVERPNELQDIHQWQIKWIEEYAHSRQEANVKLMSERALNEQQANEIVTLKAKIEQQNVLLTQMLEKLEKKSERISKYKTKYMEAQTLLNTPKPQCVDLFTNTSPILTDNSIYATHFIGQLAPTTAQPKVTCITDRSEPTIEIEETTAQPKVLAKSKEKKDVCAVSPLGKHKLADLEPVLMGNKIYVTCIMDRSEPTIKIEETTAQQKMLAKPKMKKGESKGKLKCPDCNYTAEKKYDVDVHRAEFCRTKPIKDRKCKYCSKMFTRRGLRVHLGQFLNGKHTPKGKHMNVSFDDHKAYLDEIKAEVK